MGFNATLVVMHDALHEIGRDLNFGKNVYETVLRCSARGQDIPHYQRDIPALNHCNAASWIESHHADGTALVAVGGNYGTLLGHSWGYKHHEEADKLRILKDLAESMGYRLVRKSNGKT